MIRQDYILRMIEQAAAMIAQLIRMRQGGESEAAAELEREGAARFLRLKPDDLEDWDDERLFQHLRANGSPSEFPLRLGFAVSLLQEKAKEHRGASRPDAANRSLLQAIHLLLRAGLNAVMADVPSFAPGLVDLLNSISEDALPARTRVLLICYYENTGRFALAENALFALQEQTGQDEELKRLGESFYERLGRQSDERLIRGDLPRDEVISGSGQWQRLFR